MRFNFDFQEHLKSAAITLGAEFILYFLVGLQSVESFSFAALYAVALVALRLVGKELLEIVISYVKKFLSQKETIQDIIKEVDSSSTTSTQNNG